MNAKLIKVNPFECRMWNGHERLDEYINEDTCANEVASFLSHGQMVPVLARFLVRDLRHSYELVYGARRLFVAQHLNLPLLLEVREMSDRDAVVAMDIENRLRRTVSAYERGRSYTTWLRSGLFSTQDELAGALEISPAQVSRLIRVGQMPTVLVGAFPNPTVIREKWALELLAAWEDPARRELLAAGARAMSREVRRPDPQIIYRRLIAINVRRRNTPHALGLDAHDKVIHDVKGRPLFRVRLHQNDTAILLPSKDLSDHLLCSIVDLVANMLRRAKLQPTDFERQRPILDGATTALVPPRMTTEQKTH
jgi:ParB/RepB/Spo0J family partition protein